LVEQIASFLADNALTRSWSNSVGGTVNWIERQALSDDDLRQVIGNGIARGHTGVALSDETLSQLERIKGAAIDRNTFDAVMAAHPEGPEDLIGRQAVTYATDAGYGRDRLKELAAELQGPQNQRTEAGLWANTLLGHPVMAYSAVTAGGALGTAAGLEAYNWWLASQQEQQQRAQKESQLPLS
jgi:hypothetical protein